MIFVLKRLLLLIIVMLVSPTLFAQSGLEIVTVTNNDGGGQTYTLSIQIFLLMTTLTLLPAALLMMTSFTRIIIVLAILRQALGTAQTPNAQVLIGLALFLTFFVMSPVLDQVFNEAVQPYIAEDINVIEAAQRASIPLREFMLSQTRENDLNLFVELSGNNNITSVDDIPFHILVPAFVTSELKTAFQIGFLIFIPFLVIDLVVASVLMSMGMMMLSPLIISFPFKLMLFVMIDGWALIIGTLAASFFI